MLRLLTKTASDTLPMRENHVFLHATLRLDRTNVIATACVDSIDEHGLTASCRQLLPQGELVMVTLCSDVTVWGKILHSSPGRLHVAFKSVIDLPALLQRPMQPSDLCHESFIPTVAPRPWRPGLKISEA